MKREVKVLRWLLTVVILVFVSDAEGSGSKKKKEKPGGNVHEHLHPKDLEASDDPREFIDDKHDVDGYLAVGWWYKSRDLKAAFSLIEEAIKNNPNAYQLPYLKAQLYLDQARTETPDIKIPNEKALVTLAKARNSYKVAATLGFKARDKAKAEEWGKVKEIDLRGASRMAVLMERQYGDHVEAARLANLYSTRLGGDKTLDRYKSSK
jgi:hypothetical protein